MYHEIAIAHPKCNTEVKWDRLPHRIGAPGATDGNARRRLPLHLGYQHLKLASPRVSAPDNNSLADRQLPATCANAIKFGAFATWVTGSLTREVDGIFPSNPDTPSLEIEECRKTLQPAVSSSRAVCRSAL